MMGSTPILSKASLKCMFAITIPKPSATMAHCLAGNELHCAFDSMHGLSSTTVGFLHRLQCPVCKLHKDAVIILALAHTRILLHTTTQNPVTNCHNMSNNASNHTSGVPTFVHVFNAWGHVLVHLYRTAGYMHRASHVPIGWV
jgi:hypothetical protein